MNIITFSAGTTLTWSSPVLEKLMSRTDSPFDYSITVEEGSWISSLLNLGGTVAPFIFANLLDVIGRRYTLLGTAFPIIIGYLIMSFANNVSLFYVARFLCGLTLGGISNLIPVYVGEIASSHNRGALSSLLNLTLCAGMLFSYCVGPYVNVQTFNLILAIFPAVFLVLFFIIGPESAYYYLKKGNYNLAQTALERVRDDSINVKDELQIIQKSIEETGDGTFFDIFKSEGLRKALIIPLGLMFFQQFSGIDAILFYSESIFKQAGVDLSPAICSIIVGGVQFASSVTTPFVIDRLGRKMLLQISAVGMIVSEAPFGTYSYLKDTNHDVSYLSLLPISCLIIYMVFYNFGFASLPWVLMGELFPTNVKSSASLFITFFVYLMSFFVAKYFQTVVTMIGMGVAFWIFTASCVISIPFTHFLVIETKGKTLQQIETELN